VRIMRVQNQLPQHITPVASVAEGFNGPQAERHNKGIGREIMFPLLLPLFLLFLLGGLSNDAGATKTGDIYPGSGDWVIAQATVYRNESETVDGNINIEATGSLIFDNGSIEFAVDGMTITAIGSYTFINANITCSDGIWDMHTANSAEMYGCEFSKMDGRLIFLSPTDVATDDFYYNITSCSFYGTTLSFGGWTTARVAINDTYLEARTNPAWGPAIRASFIDLVKIRNSIITGPLGVNGDEYPYNGITIGMNSYYPRSYNMNWPQNPTHILDNNTIERFSMFGVNLGVAPIEFQNNTFSYIGSDAYSYSSLIKINANLDDKEYSLVNTSFATCDLNYEIWICEGDDYYGDGDPENWVNLSNFEDIDVENIRGITDSHVGIYWWVNVTVVDAFYQPISDARVMVRDNANDLRHDGYTNGNGEENYIWLLTYYEDDDEEINYNQFTFIASKDGEGTTSEKHTIDEVTSITLRMQDYEWSQTVGVFLVNYYTNKTIPMGDLICRLNGRIMFANERSIWDEDYINITVHDHFSREIYTMSQAVNYSRTYEEYIIYVNFTTVRIFQYDEENEEPGTWVREWNLTIEEEEDDEENDIIVHFTGDEFSVAEIPGESINYTLSWAAGENHTAGSTHVRNVTGTRTHPPSSQTHKNSGTMLVNVGVKTTATITSTDQPWWWFIKEPFFYVPVALVAGVSALYKVHGGTKKIIDDHIFTQNKGDLW